MIEEKYDQVRRLINMGKERGYLLYDEVNDMFPAEVQPSGEIDDLFSIDGAPYVGEEDCCDRLDRLEEGGKFRRQIFETTSSLSVSGKESVPSPETIPGSGHRVLETPGFEGKYQPKPSGQCVR